MANADKPVILFDLDGTLTDSGEGIINSLKYAFEAYGIRNYDEKLLNRFLGPPLMDSFQDILGFDELKAREAVEKFREYFRETGILENRLYDGVAVLLQTLAADGRKLILATSKAEVFAERILKHFNIAQYFHTIAGSELDGTRTRKSEVIRYALDKAGITDLNGAVMVGDREHDVIGAREAGIDVIGVLYGYGSEEELRNAGATDLAATVEDLQKIFLAEVPGI